MTTTPATDRPVLRLSGPAELAAALPQLCGFPPQESLVAVTLHGPRRRVGLTLRFDLPPRAHDEALVADLVDRVVCTGSQEVLAVLCTEAPDDPGLPRARLVRRLRRGLRRAGVDAPDALLVRAGRWWSYVRDDAGCCPPGGTPLQGLDDCAALSVLAADAALNGRVVLPSRADLVRSLAPPAASPAATAALAEARAVIADRTRTQGRVAVGRAALAAWRTALRAAPRTLPTPQQVAGLVVALDDVVVRDEVLASVLDDDEALLWLLLRLAERTPSPDDVAVCALLGWVAHARGDGALAGVALDRALAADPGCSLAALGRQALDAQVDPPQVREMLTAGRRVLQAAHPWARP